MYFVSPRLKKESLSLFLKASITL